MNKKFKKVSIGLALSLSLVLGTGSAFAKSFGNPSSGASSKESYQIRYDGAAWNYKSSPYKSTSFKYARNGRTLMSKTAYSSKVTGSVWDDLRWGDKYNTKFSWSRGN